MAHIPVLKNETIDGLQIHAGDIIIDGTLGGGGHTNEIIARFGADVKIIGFDLDADAIQRAKETIADKPHDLVFRNVAFDQMDKSLEELHINHVDRIMLDLGVSSFQIDVSERGFSFMKDEPLLMTMKKSPSDEDLTAMDIVNTWEEKTLADIIYGFGEEKYSRKIAHAIITARKEKKIETTFELVHIIDSAVGRAYKGQKIHPSTRTFQALRIAVNRELESIQEAIEKGFHLLSPGGRMAIISFHSLEDRIVKQAFQKFKKEGHATIITKKPIVPSIAEIKANSRARSSKLRIIEKIHHE